MTFIIIQVLEISVAYLVNLAKLKTENNLKKLETISYLRSLTR